MAQPRRRCAEESRLRAPPLCARPSRQGGPRACHHQPIARPRRNTPGRWRSRPAGRGRVTSRSRIGSRRCLARAHRSGASTCPGRGLRTSRNTSRLLRARIRWSAPVTFELRVAGRGRPEQSRWRGALALAIGRLRFHSPGPGTRRAFRARRWDPLRSSRSP